MYSRFPTPPQDGDRAVRTVLRDYDLKKLTGAYALEGMLFFKDQGDADDQIAWGRAWLQAKDSGNTDKVVRDEAIAVARLLEGKNDFRGASEVLHLGADQPVGMLTRLELLRQFVMVECDDLDDADAALEATKEWEKKINTGSTDAVRRLAGSTLY